MLEEIYTNDHEFMACFRKLRIGTATNRGRKPIIFGIPLALMDYLEWNGGETVRVIADKNDKTLTLKVVQDGKD